MIRAALPILCGLWVVACSESVLRCYVSAAVVLDAAQLVQNCKETLLCYHAMLILLYVCGAMFWCFFISASNLEAAVCFNSGLQCYGGADWR